MKNDADNAIVELAEAILDYLPVGKRGEQKLRSAQRHLSMAEKAMNRGEHGVAASLANGAVLSLARR